MPVEHQGVSAPWYFFLEHPASLGVLNQTKTTKDRASGQRASENRGSVPLCSRRNPRQRESIGKGVCRRHVTNTCADLRPHDWTTTASGVPASPSANVRLDNPEILGATGRFQVL